MARDGTTVTAVATVTATATLIGTGLHAVAAETATATVVPLVAVIKDMVVAVVDVTTTADAAAEEAVVEVEEGANAETVLSVVARHQRTVSR
jgi:hypothetical protein